MGPDVSLTVIARESGRSSQGRSYRRPFPRNANDAHMIRAAIVGLGRWGRSLVASVQGKSKDLRFVLAHARTRATAGDFCRGQGLALVDSYEQVLADPNVDAVVLATPHSLHESQIIAAAAAGKHIHVEKPITLDRAGADRAVAAARKAGVVLAVGYCRRFHPSVGEGRRPLPQRPPRTLPPISAQAPTPRALGSACAAWGARRGAAPVGGGALRGGHAPPHCAGFPGRGGARPRGPPPPTPGPPGSPPPPLAPLRGGPPGFFFGPGPP